MQIIDWPIADVRPYENNPRLNAEAVAKVAESLRHFGWRQPLVVDQHGVLIVGHTRLLAARSLGMESVPVHIAHDLSDEAARAYRIADNRSADEATWDDNKLIAELERLQEGGLEMSLIGFDDDELAKYLGGDGNWNAEDTSPVVTQQWLCVVTCANEQQLQALYARLDSEGYACKLVT